MSLPIPHFQAPWKATVQHELTIAFEDTDSYTYTIAAGTEFASTWHLLKAFWGYIYAADPPASVTAASHLWPYINDSGQVVIYCDNDIFALSEVTTATYKVLEWLGLDPAGYTDVDTATGTAPHYRGWYPGLPLVEAPIFSRTLNPVRAVYYGLDGAWAHATTWQKASTKGGFISARFSCQFTDSATDATTAQNIHHLLSYLAGCITPASDLDYGGSGVFGAWTGALSAALNLDALPRGGVSENPIAYFDDTIPSATYVGRGGSPGDYLDLQIAEMETWYLHPDSKAFSVVPKYERHGDIWLVEFEAFMEAA